jgi:hypothetical protein
MSKFSMKIATTVAVIGGIAAGAVSASAALNLPTQSCSYVFNTNMRLGSRGTDVMNLQKNIFLRSSYSPKNENDKNVKSKIFISETIDW